MFNFEADGAFRLGLKAFSKTWTRSISDHFSILDALTQMTTTITHCRILACDVHNLSDKAQRLLGYDVSRFRSSISDAEGLLSQLNELQLAWTAWMMKSIGSNAQRTGGGYQMTVFGAEAAWLRFHIHHRLRCISRGESASHAHEQRRPPVVPSRHGFSPAARRLPPQLPTPSAHRAAPLPPRSESHRLHLRTPTSTASPIKPASAPQPHRRAMHSRPSSVPATPYRRPPSTPATLRSATTPSAPPADASVSLSQQHRRPPPRPATAPSKQPRTPTTHQRLYAIGIGPKEALIPLPPSNVHFF